MSPATSPPARRAGGLVSLKAHNIAITVSDLGVAIAWYRDVLGFELLATAEIAEGDVALIAGAGIQLELLHPSRRPEAPARHDPLFADPPHHLGVIGNKFLVFEVDDLAAASDELESLEVTVIWREKELAPGFVSTAIRDFDDNLINILQHS